MAEPSPATVPTASQKQLELYREPISTPGLVPVHLKRATVDANPLIEVIQRFLVHIKPGSGNTVEHVVAFVALYRVASPVWNYTKELFLRSFTSRISVPEFDPVAQEMLQWVSDEVVNKRRSTSATLMTGEIGRIQPEMYGMYAANLRLSGQQKQQSEEVQCVPPVGKKIFWIGLRPFLFARTGNIGNSNRDNGHKALTYQGTPPNSIILITPGWSLRPLMDFIKKCHDHKIANKAGTTNIYFSSGKMDPYSGQLWSTVVKAKRKLDTVDMDDKLKSELVNDAEYYYSEDSKKFFADCGVPYRRGYLFYGPPGTGKTSFSAALAGHLRCDLYLINLATGDISDGHLHRLFLALPRKCVVVIEDIDSCGIGREQGPTSHLPGLPNGATPGVPMQPMSNGPHLPSRSHTPKRNMITLSGLLNAIDGNASAEGRLLIMTSNNPDYLDEALIRPGRIDLKVHFSRMKSKAIHDIFTRLIGRAAITAFSYTSEQIEEYAMNFANRVPADTFTPAQVQNYLQNCRGDPVKAIEEVDDWIEKTRGQAPEEAVNDGHAIVPPTAVTDAIHEDMENSMLAEEANGIIR